jgi:2-oxoglutarate ferredoxin oxidoreductase subunit delta
VTVRIPILPQPRPPRGTVHIRADLCKGCQLCIECCPTHVLALSTSFNAKGYRYPTVASDGCIVCQACATICPDYAIFATPFHSETGRIRPLEPALGPS